jgi:hypothetical protein
MLGYSRSSITASMPMLTLLNRDLQMYSHLIYGRMEVNLLLLLFAS